MSVIFFQCIPAELIILRFQSNCFPWPLFLPRMKVLLQCGAHQWKAVEEYCRDAVREKKKKNTKANRVRKVGKKQQIHFHCGNLHIDTDTPNAEWTPRVHLPSSFPYLTMSSCYSHSVSISREEVQEVTFDQKNSVILSGDLWLVCVCVCACWQQCSNGHHKQRCKLLYIIPLIIIVHSL